MPGPPEPALERLVAEVLARPKYAGLLPAFVAWVGRRELGRARSHAQALQATRRRLHLAVGAYAGRPHWARVADRLEADAAQGDLRTACRRALACHASTRERLAGLERFARRALGEPGRVRSVLDLACGLQPLALPWMGFPPEVRYRACDVDRGLLGVVERFFRLAGTDGRAFACNLLEECPRDEADLGLLLKALPALEELGPGTTRRLLRELRVRCLLVSFPAASLGGRRRGLAAAHEARFLELVAGEPWRVEGVRLPDEAVFRLERR